jgi:hypothetical protein
MLSTNSSQQGALVTVGPANKKIEHLGINYKQLGD